MGIISPSSGISSLAAIAAVQPYPVAVAEAGQSFGGFTIKGDLRTVYDGAITAGTNVVTCATSKPFTAADVDKYLVINSAATVALVEGAEPGATKQWNPLCAKITAFLNSEKVELDTNAFHTTAGSFVRYGSDDGAAIVEAMKQVVKKAQESGGGLCALWLPKLLGCARELDTSQEGYAQLPFPFVPATSGGSTAQGPKVILHIYGGPDASAPPLWYQHVAQETGGGIFTFGPKEAGGKLVSSVCQPGIKVGSGRPSVFGGPTPEKGFTGLNYNNMYVIIEGVTMSGPCNGTMTDWELNGTACARVKGGTSSFRLGIPNLVGAAQGNGPNEYVMASAGMEGTFALRPATAMGEPLAGNNDKTVIDSHTCEGHTTALEIGEHSTHGHLVSVYNFFSLVPATSAWIHGAEIDYLSAEACRFGVYTPPNNGAGCFISCKRYDVEAGVERWATVPKGWFWDPGSLNKGIFYWGAGEHESEENLEPLINGGLQTRHINLGNSAGKVASPVFETGVEKRNTFGKDAWVEVEKCTAVEVDGQAKKLVGEVGAFIVPAGKSYKFTGATGAAKWTLIGS